MDKNTLPKIENGILSGSVNWLPAPSNILNSKGFEERFLEIDFYSSDEQKNIWLSIGRGNNESETSLYIQSDEKTIQGKVEEDVKFNNDICMSRNYYVLKAQHTTSNGWEFEKGIYYRAWYKYHESKLELYRIGFFVADVEHTEYSDGKDHPDNDKVDFLAGGGVKCNGKPAKDI